MAEDPKDDPGVAPEEDVEEPIEIPELNTFELLAKESPPDELLKEGLGVTKGSGFGEKDDPDEEDDTNEGSEEKDEDDKSMTGEEGDP